MASEKVEMTSSADMHAKEVGEAGSHGVEFQGGGNDTPPVAAPSRDTFEVRLVASTATNLTRLSERCAEIHQPVLGGLLQHHRALLVGSVRHHFPIRTAQWRAFVDGVRMHSRGLWSDCWGLV